MAFKKITGIAVTNGVTVSTGYTVPVGKAFIVSSIAYGDNLVSSVKIYVGTSTTNFYSNTGALTPSSSLEGAGQFRGIIFTAGDELFIRPQGAGNLIYHISGEEVDN